MKFKANINQDLFDLGILSKPEVEIVEPAYNWKTNKIRIQLEIKEEGSMFIHGRSFELTNQVELSSDDIVEIVSNFLGPTFNKI